MNRYIKITEVIRSLTEEAQERLDEYSNNLIGSKQVDEQSELFKNLGISVPGEEEHPPEFIEFDLEKDYVIKTCNKWIYTNSITSFEEPLEGNEYCIIDYNKTERVEIKESIEYLIKHLVDRE